MEHVDLALRLVVAAILGCVIGFEREFYGKAAGFRTHALVAVGSALIMEVSLKIFEEYQGVATNIDPARIAAQVVSGIGFIGAGAIIRSGVSVKGITTAASLWAVSGIGLACGMGFYEAAIYATLTVVAILTLLSKFESKFQNKGWGKSESLLDDNNGED